MATSISLWLQFFTLLFYIVFLKVSHTFPFAAASACNACWLQDQHAALHLAPVVS